MISPLRLRYELLPMNQIGYYGCTTWAQGSVQDSHIFWEQVMKLCEAPKHGESRGLRMVMDSSRPAYLIGGFNPSEKY